MGASVSSLDCNLSMEQMQIFAEMKLTREELKCLFKRFKKMDENKDDHIDTFELLMLIDEEKSPLHERLFEAFDRDGTGGVDFNEFVVSMWRFCTLDNHSLSKSVFCCLYWHLY